MYSNDVIRCLQTA